MQRSIQLAPTHDDAPSVVAAIPPQRLRLDMLDGLRGLAALYVALFHAVLYSGYANTPRDALSAPMQLVAFLFDYGTYAVPVFIVLSGFCLMLPLVQRNTTELPGGFAAFVRRRAWRILPPYYAALLLALGVIALAPALQTPQGTAWDTKLPITLDAVMAHLLLIHNLRPDWIFRIDGPMWSVSVEWQIYFLFPAILLPILRRTNMALTVVAALALGLLPHLLLPASMGLDDSHLWFLGLFAMGMAGAAIAFSDGPRALAYRTQARWRWLNIALTLVVLGGLVWNHSWMDWHAYLFEPLAGLVVMHWLVRFTAMLRSGAARSAGLRLLESRVLVGLGGFSYSLYLIHNPIQALFNLESLRLPISADARLALMLGVATPFSIGCAYVFYLLVERRAVRMKERAARPA